MNFPTIYSCHFEAFHNCCLSKKTNLACTPEAVPMKHESWANDIAAGVHSSSGNLRPVPPLLRAWLGRTAGALIRILHSINPLIESVIFFPANWESQSRQSMTLQTHKRHHTPFPLFNYDIKMNTSFWISLFNEIPLGPPWKNNQNSRSLMGYLKTDHFSDGLFIHVWWCW